MVKSAVLFSKKPLHIYIFAEDDLHDSFKTAVSLLCLSFTRASAPECSLLIFLKQVSDYDVVGIASAIVLLHSWTPGLPQLGQNSSLKYMPLPILRRMPVSGRNSSNPVLHRGSFCQ